MVNDPRRILMIGAVEALPHAQVESIREAFTQSGYEVHLEAAVFSQVAPAVLRTRPDAVIVCASSAEPGGVGLRLARYTRRLRGVSGRAPVLLAGLDARVSAMTGAVVRAGLADGTIALSGTSADVLIAAVEQAVSAGPVPSSRRRVLMDGLPAVGGALLCVVLLAPSDASSLPGPLRTVLSPPVRPALALLGAGLLMAGSAFHLRDRASVRSRVSSAATFAIGAAIMIGMVFGLLRS